MFRLRPGTLPVLLLAGIALAALFPGWAAAQRPGLDVAGTVASSPAARAHVARLRSDAALIRLGTPTSIEERFGVPTFVWATRAAGRAGAQAAPGARTPGGMQTPGGAPTAVPGGIEPAARAHVARLAPLYRLDAGDAAAARLRHVHDTGRGGIIATFDQVVDGVEVFRDELKILMNRDRELIAASGYIPSRSLTGRSNARSFRLGPAAAIATALQDFSGAAVSPASLRRDGALPGGYESYLASVAGVQPVRIKKVLFHLPDELRPSWYLELLDDTNAYAYVVSAGNGEILFRQDLTVSDSYTYRVWANTSAPFIPMDGPHGDSPTPHPTGVPDGYNPPFIAPNLVSLQNGPISTNDPWLPPGATETTGNNVDAYADLATPDGFTAGDLRASTTGLNTFDRVYDTSLAPGASSDQRMASVTQLFYVNNFLHDWFYDDGFDEASGNAQTSNYGRGGIEGDRLRAEAQDYNGMNNANMATPADGGSPRMQMYVFTGAVVAELTIVSPPLGDYPVGVAAFGPTSFSVTGDIVLVDDGTAPVNDGCQPILNSVAGKIALIDRGNCTFTAKVQNAQDAGAIGVIIANNSVSSTPPAMGGSSGTISIPVLSVTQAAGNDIKAALLNGPVTGTLSRQQQVNRDGTLDNLIVAHEWGHYISNRLVSGGLSSNQARGLGEGWSDFHALLMAVRDGENFGGAYGMASYATSSYYFGIRRYPFSTDLSKNPLTFQHIANGVPLPVGPPVAYGGDGSNNAEVHNTGEVWCSMLWECYAALLGDTGRLTFDQAQSRMKAYLVAAYKMTPGVPTLTEARDALLAVAHAADPLDFDLFCQGFAKRGAGTGAVSPDRFSNDNTGVVESFACGGDLAFVSAAITDAPNSCDNDGYLDEGETGEVHVTLRNVGATTLSATTATLSSTNPFVSFPSGAGASFPSSSPFGTTTASVPVRLSGGAGIQIIDIQISFDDPGLLAAGPRLASMTAYGNVDEVPSTIETAEELNSTCTSAGNPVVADYAWRRLEISPSEHRFHAPDAGSPSDQYLITPPLQVAGSGSFSFQFSHRHSFEADGTDYYDGGVLEISNDGGATWTDIGASASPGYGGTLFTGSGNVLSGRPAFVATSAAYPNLSSVTVDLGTAYAGQTVQLRFRLGTDAAVSDYGWDIDDLQVFNVTNQPFFALIAEPTVCTVAVGEALPTELAFSLAGANPVRSGGAQFRFALPTDSHVQIALYDIAGRRVAMLADGEFPAGQHVAAWKDRAPSAGVYFARMTTGGRELKQRVVVIP